MLFGEKMPDKERPEIQRAPTERDVGCERRFAKATRIDKSSCRSTEVPTPTGRCFSSSAFGFAICGLTWNIHRLTVVYAIYPTAGRHAGCRIRARERHKITLSVPHVRGIRYEGKWYGKAE